MGRTTMATARPRSRARTRGAVVVLAAVVAVALVTLPPAPSVGPLHAPTAAAASEYPTVDGKFEGEGSIGPGRTYDFYVTGRGGVPAANVSAVALNIAVTNATADTYLTVFPDGADRPVAANMNVAAGQTLSNMVIAKTGTGGGWISIYNFAGTVDVIVDVLGWYPTNGQYTALTPARLADTRAGFPTIDGQQSGSGAVAGGATLDVTVTGRGNVPATGVGAVVMNVAATGATAGTYLTAYPTGEPRPVAANMNVAPGQTVSNMVIAKVGANGSVSIYNFAGTVDVIVDVLGWFPSAGQYTGLVPARLADTRVGYPTIDGQQSGSGALGAGATLDITVTGRGNVPASGVDAVALNVAVTNPTSGSFLTVFPTGAARPLAANMNIAPGQTASNMVIAKVGANGKISIFNFAGTVDVVVDVLGWYPANGQYTGLTPARLVDTRISPPPGGPLRFDLSGAVGVTLGGHVGTDPNAALWVVTATGERPAAVSGSAVIENVQVLGGRVFVAFATPISLDDTRAPGTCILAEIDRASGVPRCLDARHHSITSAHDHDFPLPTNTAFIQSDAASNLYYTAEGANSLKVEIVRMTSAGTNPVSIMNDGYYLQDFQVMPDGTVFASVLNFSTQRSYFRRIATNGSVKDTPVQLMPWSIEPTADGNVLVGVYDSDQWRVKRWLTAADRFDTTDWITPTGAGAVYAANPLCTGMESGQFCTRSGADVTSFVHTDDGSLFAFSREGATGRLIRYWPTVAPLDTPLLAVSVATAVPGGLVLSGSATGSSQQVLVFHDTQTGAERVLVPASEKLFFEGVGWDAVDGRIVFTAYRNSLPGNGVKVGYVTLAGAYSVSAAADGGYELQTF